MNDIDKLRIYQVQYSIQGDHGYRSSRSLTVVTTDLMRAAEICMTDYPSCSVWNVSHKGSIDKIDERCQINE